MWFEWVQKDSDTRVNRRVKGVKEGKLVGFALFEVKSEDVWGVDRNVGKAGHRWMRWW